MTKNHGIVTPADANGLRVPPAPPPHDDPTSSRVRHPSRILQCASRRTFLSLIPAAIGALLGVRATQAKPIGVFSDYPVIGDYPGTPFDDPKADTVTYYAGANISLRELDRALLWSTKAIKENGASSPLMLRMNPTTLVWFDLLINPVASPIRSETVMQSAIFRSGRFSVVPDATLYDAVIVGQPILTNAWVPAEHRFVIKGFALWPS